MAHQAGRGTAEQRVKLVVGISAGAVPNDKERRRAEHYYL